jgi:hypothetical protein
MDEAHRNGSRMAIASQLGVPGIESPGCGSRRCNRGVTERRGNCGVPIRHRDRLSCRDRGHVDRNCSVARALLGYGLAVAGFVGQLRFRSRTP